jgi:hypothetical protein
MSRMKRLGVFLAAIVLTANVGCDKLKAMANKGDASAESQASGGGLGSLFDSSFVGEISTEVSSKSDKTPKALVVGIKSPKLRADISALASDKNDPFLSQGAAVILDPPAKKAYVLVRAKKMAMVIDFGKMSVERQKPPSHPGGPSAPAGGGTGGKPEEPPKIDKTGKKEVIAGYVCEDWKITSKDGHADLCMAEGIKLMDFSDLATAAPQLAAAAVLGDLNHFPLKVVAFDTAGVETARLETKKIEKKTLPDTDFVVPADYQQMDMAQMMAQMMGGHPGAMPMGGMPGHPGMPPGSLPGHPGMPPHGKATH